MKLLTETLPDVSRSRMLRRWLAASMSFSRGQWLGRPLLVSVAGRRSTWRKAKRKRANCFSDAGIVSGRRSRRNWQIRRPAAGEASASGSRRRRRAALIEGKWPPKERMFHELGIISDFTNLKGNNCDLRLPRLHEGSISVT